MCAMLGLALSAAAQTSDEQTWRKSLPVLRIYEWKDLRIQQDLPGSEIITTNGTAVLKIEKTNKAPLEITLLAITNASLIKKAYSVSCEMKYENVSGAGPWGNQNRLQLVCDMPPPVPGGDESTNGSGFRPILGTANWDFYDFPVDRNVPGNMALSSDPIQMDLKLTLLGEGTVYLRPIKLWGLKSSGGWWWSEQQGGLIGGIGGSVIGCLGGLLGWLASKGKGRNFVLGTMKLLIVAGVLLTLAGLIAALLKQPYFVWYALLLPGVILVLVLSLNMHSIRRRYDELEIRRMTSMDATGR